MIDIFFQGDLFMTEMLDSETRNLYSLVVQAQDNASVPNSAYSTVVHTKCYFYPLYLIHLPPFSAGDNCRDQC